MKFRLTTISLFLIFFSCGNNENAQSNEDWNVQQISTDAPITRDFDREKYPILQKAILLRLDGQFKEAIKEFGRAEIEYGEMIQIYLNRGVTFYQLGHTAKAEADFTRCIEIDSTYVPPFINRGIIYAHSDRIPKALADLNKAIILDSTEPVSYYNRAIAYGKIGKRELACTDLRKARSLGYSERYGSNVIEESMEELNCEQ